MNSQHRGHALAQIKADHLNDDFFTDKPARIDTLGSESYVESFSNYILECPAPLTIGIDGEWGSGKSSFMLQVKSKILDLLVNKGTAKKDRENRFYLQQKTIASVPFFFTFDAWRFSVLKPEDIGRRLVRAVINELDAKIADHFLEKWKMLSLKDLDPQYQPKQPGITDRVKYAIKRAYLWLDSDYRAYKIKTVPFGRKFMDILTALSTPVSMATEALSAQSIKAKHIQKMIAGLRKVLGMKELTSIDDIIIQQKQIFKQYVKSALKLLNRRKIIIFIDDIDRLPPLNAVILLEYIKNFLDIEQCVFVIAYDKYFLNHGIIERFPLLKNSPEESNKAFEFFQKIIQVPFPMRNQEYGTSSIIYAYMGKFEEKGLSIGYKETNNPKENQPVLDFIDKVSALCMGHNPRKVKSVLNGLEAILYTLQPKKELNEIDNFSEYGFIELVVNYITRQNFPLFLEDLKVLREDPIVLQLLRDTNKKMTTTQGENKAAITKEEVLTLYQDYFNIVEQLLTSIESLMENDNVVSIQVIKEELTSKVSESILDESNHFNSFLQFVTSQQRRQKVARASIGQYEKVKKCNQYSHLAKEVISRFLNIVDSENLPPLESPEQTPENLQVIFSPLDDKIGSFFLSTASKLNELSARDAIIELANSTNEILNNSYISASYSDLTSITLKFSIQTIESTNKEKDALKNSTPSLIRIDSIFDRNDSSHINHKIIFNFRDIHEHFPELNFTSQYKENTYTKEAIKLVETEISTWKSSRSELVEMFANFAKEFELEKTGKKQYQFEKELQYEQISDCLGKLKTLYKEISKIEKSKRALLKKRRAMSTRFEKEPSRGPIH